MWSPWNGSRGSVVQRNKNQNVAAAPNESATKAPLKKICKAASSMEVTSRE
jgi:hypothetical protein